MTEADAALVEPEALALEGDEHEGVPGEIFANLPEEAFDEFMFGEDARAVGEFVGVQAGAVDGDPVLAGDAECVQQVPGAPGEGEDMGFAGGGSRLEVDVARVKRVGGHPHARGIHTVAVEIPVAAPEQRESGGLHGADGGSVAVGGVDEARVLSEGLVVALFQVAEDFHLPILGHFRPAEETVFVVHLRALQAQLLQPLLQSGFGQLFAQKIHLEDADFVAEFPVPLSQLFAVALQGFGADEPRDGEVHPEVDEFVDFSDRVVGGGVFDERLGEEPRGLNEQCHGDGGEKGMFVVGSHDSLEVFQKFPARRFAVPVVNIMRESGCARAPERPSRHFIQENGFEVALPTSHRRVSRGDAKEKLKKP